VPEIRRLITKYTADNLTPKAGCIDDAPFFSSEQDIEVQSRGGLHAKHVYMFLSNQQDNQECLQRKELLHLELRVWRRRCMQTMTSPDAMEAMNECFFQEHDEEGNIRSLQEPNDSELTPEEKDEKMMVQKELNKLPETGPFVSSGLDAESVRQKQQEKQKQRESAKEIQKKDFPILVWKLSHLLSVDQDFFHCISTKFPDDFSFYPDFIYASYTFAGAVLHPRGNYLLPRVEAFVEVNPSGDGQNHSRASGRIVFITLQEADTLCRLLRKTSDANLQQRLSLFVFDSNGYWSNVNPNPGLDAHCPPLSCSSIDQLVDFIDKPSQLHLGLAFSRLFNCSLQYDVLQITWIMSWLHQWHSRRPHQTAESVRDLVSSSFNKLAKYRGSGIEFKYSPALMAATHDDLFMEGNFETRWCPAIKLMLRVAVQVNAFPPYCGPRGANRKGDLDLQQEVAAALQSTENVAAASCDMFHIVSCVQWCIS
jgi:hypothetical protein